MQLNRKFAYITIPAIYLIAGLVWITFSDAALISLSASPGWTHSHYNELATYKGYLYVAVTSVLLGVLIRSAFKSIISAKNDFKRLFAENPHPMWIYDLKTLKFMLVNDAACKAYGYTREEFYRMNLFAIRPAEEYDRLKEVVTRHQPGSFATEKWLHKGKDGVPFYVNIFANDTVYGNKRCRMVTAVNINREMLAEIERANVKHALDSAALVSVTDLNGVILQANEKFCEVSGYTETELVGQNHSIVNSGYHPSDFWKHMWRTIAKGKTWRADICNRRKDGTLYWVDTFINAVYNSEGKIYKFMSVRYLITERKQLEREQNLLLKDLSHYAFQTSHELRGPVARLLGLSSLFNEYPEKQFLVDKIRDTATEIDSVIAKMNEALDRNAYPLLKKHEERCASPELPKQDG